jgi:hypothetical protein
MGLRMVSRSSGMGGIFPGLINTLRLPLRVRFGRRRGSQPALAMAEFAETAATLAPQIERFFRGGSGVAGPEISPCCPIGLRGRLRVRAAAVAVGRQPVGFSRVARRAPPRGMSAIPSMAAARVAAGVTSLTGQEERYLITTIEAQ